MARLRWLALSLGGLFALPPLTFGSAAPPGPPPQAVSAGMTRLDFYDDFNDANTSFLAFNGEAGKTWNAGLWWWPAGRSKPSDFSISNSLLTIHDDTISTLQTAPPYNARTFLGGYFEARLYCTGWCGFWLFSSAWAEHTGMECGNHCTRAQASAVGRQLEAQFGGVAEIDIMEGRYSLPNTGFFTLHRNTLGARDSNEPDQGNPNYRQEFNFPIIGAWHTYGALWTKKTISWYLDNRLVATTKAYPSTWQPCFLILDTMPDNLEKGKTDDPVNEIVDWVRVWEPPAK